MVDLEMAFIESGSLADAFESFQVCALPYEWDQMAVMMVAGR